ncbi:MAG: hypothetical protein AAFX00_00770, partial [Pseudomonadota bacterium]
MAFTKLDTTPLTAEQKRTQHLIRAAMPQLMIKYPPRRYGAFALGIGCQKKGGPICLRFYAEVERDETRLAADRRIPKSIEIDAGGGSTITVPTAKVVRPAPRPAMPDPEDTLRPVPGAASISIPGTGGNGTLGGWVLDATDETVVALTNRHVSGGLLGAPVIQPGSNDGGSFPQDRIGFVKRTVEFIPLPQGEPQPSDCNFVDAAIIGADDPDLIDLSVIDIGPGIYQIDSAAMGDTVQKSGQTTGLTTGVVVDEDLNFEFSVPISPGNFIDVGFCDCLLIDDVNGPFLMPGDSGAVVFGQPSPADSVVRPAVGLLFGETGGGGGYACKIEHVFSALNLGVLCSAGYPAYLEGLAEGPADPGLASEARFSTTSRPLRASAGLARDVERRMGEGKTGREIVA